MSTLAILSRHLRPLFECGNPVLVLVWLLVYPLDVSRQVGPAFGTEVAILAAVGFRQVDFPRGEKENKWSGFIEYSEQ